MFGLRNTRKKVAEKKKWQEELEGNQAKQDDNVNIEKIEIQQDESDLEKQGESKNQPIQSEKQMSAEKEVEDKKQSKDKKKYDWMDSEDDQYDVDSSVEKSDSEESDQEKNEAPKAVTQSNTKKQDQQSAGTDTKRVVTQNALEDKDKRSIFVNNLNYELTDDDIASHFKQYGTILDIDVPRNEYGNMNKGRAFIEYQTSEEALNV